MPNTPSNIDSPVYFMGATVKGFDTKAGLNEDISGVTISLVCDPVLSQVFTPPNTGTPIQFTFGSFSFTGLFQYYTYNDSSSGRVYTVFLTSPLEVLGGTKVILGDYWGYCFGTPNLMNPYGYMEHLYGFGGSLSNSAGIPWEVPVTSLDVSISGTLNFGSHGQIGLKPALESLFNNDDPNYGSGITFKGHTYQLNLQKIHNDLGIPTYYRVGGTSQSLLEIISAVYHDSGYDYFIDMATGVGHGPHTITMKSISRRSDPPTGQIGTFIGANPNYIAFQSGVELRNEITSAFLIGANQEKLYLQYENLGYIAPYWGEDLAGNTIIGSGTGDNYRVDLNAGPIVDILAFLGGGYSYNVSPTELRCALVDYDSWAFYVCKRRFATVAQPLGIASTATKDDLPVAPFLADFISEDPYAASIFASGVSENLVNKSGRLYEFVKSYATEYYGKKWIVKLPSISFLRLESETNNVQYSEVPVSNAYFPEGSAPLGLSYLNEVLFTDPQGKFRAFALYSDVTNADLTSINPAESVLQADISNIFTSLYTGCAIDDRILTLPQNLGQGVVATFSTPVFAKPDSYLGNITDLADLFGCTNADIANATNYYTDTFPVKIYPRCLTPDAVAVPMRSNVDSYGPYRELGVNGKVEFIRDESLAPWTYGGFGAMNTAAALQIQSITTNMQNSETGSVTVPGFPTKNLIDPLVASGSEITGIETRVAGDGWQTTYSLHNYSPRKGAFSKDRINQMQRMGQTLLQTRRNLREAVREQKQRSVMLGARQLGILERASVAVNQQSPQGVVVSHTVRSSGNKYGFQTTVQKFKETVGNLKTNNNEVYRNTAAMSLDGLLVGYSNNLDLGPSGIPHFQSYDSRLGLHSKTRSDWELIKGSGSNIGFISNGQNFNGLNTKRGNIDYNDVRAISLRGPLTLTGWGYDIRGYPFPNATGGMPSGYLPSGISPTGYYASGTRTSTPAQNLTGAFYADYRNRADKFLSGPLTTYWNDYTKTWTANTVMRGKALTDITAATSSTFGSGLVSIMIDSAPIYDYMVVYNFFGTAVPSGRRVQWQFDENEGLPMVYAADCVSL